MHLEGKNVLIVGLARSGIAAARYLQSHGARVTANDIKSEAQLGSATEGLRRLGVTLALGSHPVELFTGADLIVLSPGVPSELEALRAATHAGVAIISETELAASCMRGHLIGITGSNGKTTTTTLIGELLRAAGAHTLVGGNIGLALSGLIEQTREDSWVVAELSSFQLETIATLHPQVAVVTNITPDHLDRHGSFANYIAAKHRLLRNQTAADFVVLNAEDAGVQQMVATLGIPSQAVYFSSREEPHPQASLYLREGFIWTTQLSADRSETKVLAMDELPIPGRHNVENVMAALGAVFCAMGTTADQLEPLCEAIRAFKGVEHRIEFVAEIEGVRFYNDSKATNVDSTIKALEAFSGNIVLILGGKDKGGDFRTLDALVRERVKAVILLGAASDKIAEQLGDAHPLQRAVSMADAIEKSFATARAGDTVLLAPACASFDMFDSYEHRGRVFKEIVNELAARKATGSFQTSETQAPSR